jgi:hypothetical protein
VATSIQPPARLMSTPYRPGRPHDGLRAGLIDRRFSLDGALQIIREELPAETPAATWTFEMNGKAVTVEKFSQLANTPGVTGDFVASAPGGAARIQSRPVEGR